MSRAPAERHDLVHRQEVAGVVELLDHARARRRAARATVGGHAAGVAPRARPRRSSARRYSRRRRAVGQPLRRIAIAQLAERERAARGDVERARDRGGIVGEQLAERVRRAQIVLVVAADQPARGRERDAVADAGEHVLQRAARARVIEHLGRRRRAGSRRRRASRAQARLARRRSSARRWRASSAYSAIAERVLHARGGGGIDRRPQRDEPRGVRADLVPRDERLALVERRRPTVTSRTRFAQPARSIANSTI